MTLTDPPPQTPADLTTEWLSTVLHSKVTSFKTERVGTGQIADSYRIHLQYASGDKGPGSVFLKVASLDTHSREAAASLHLYEREVRFYAEVIPKIDAAVARCYYASFEPDSGTFCLVLEDASPAIVGNDILGATIEQARAGVKELGRLHGQLLGDASLAPWLKQPALMNQTFLGQLFNVFMERYSQRVKIEHRQVCEKLVTSYDALVKLQGSSNVVEGLVHGDFRLDNLLFGQDGADSNLTIVDFQTVTWGPAMSDVAYFLGCALKNEDRRTYSDELIRLYHSALGPNAPLTLDECREGVRNQSFFGVVMAICSPILAQRTDRGDDMFMTLLDRNCTQVLDLKALDILPNPTLLTPLRPDVKDELQHSPGSELWWNESWYFDFIDITSGIGGWIRLGLYPNQKCAWYTALVCGPGRPTIAVVDFEAPLPDKDLSLNTEAIHSTQTVEVPLERYRVTLQGKGESHSDPSALLRGERGRAVDLSINLAWHTDGHPYSYRITSRYEVPCKVTGTIVADGESHSLTAVPGQRDHSFGVRDWWSMDWVWSALHFDDGTRVHGLDLRMPGSPRLSMGYVQGPTTPITELTTHLADDQFTENGLPAQTTLKIAPKSLIIDVKPLGHGPLRLDSTDGRTTMFTRAWGTVTTSDGQRGVGWMEWNQNTPKA